MDISFRTKKKKKMENEETKKNRIQMNNEIYLENERKIGLLGAIVNIFFS